MTECPDLVQRYIAWLTGEIACERTSADHVSVVVPFLDRRNDYVELFIREGAEELQLHDDGYTSNGLRESGLALEEPTRRAVLDVTLARLGLGMDEDGRITTSATLDTFPGRFHALLQGVLNVGEMANLHRSNVARMFEADVSGWLDAKSIPYTPDVTFRGKSGFEQQFDFEVDLGRRGALLVKAVNNVDVREMKLAAFAWSDVQSGRPSNTKGVLLYNDRRRAIAPSERARLLGAGLHALAWSDRDSLTDIAKAAANAPAEVPPQGELWASG